MHSDWSDGGSPVERMARTAAELGHEYLAMTDHSPRLTIAHGLSPERLREQLDLVDALNEELAPLRILRGIEVDILEDGTLDQDDELLAELDVVVASVHSKLKMSADGMTARMIGAIANPHMDILGHCTGRLIVGKGRAESQFDAELVFAACRQLDKAVEVNCRPERLDPPRRLLAMVDEMGCKISIDTDAHAPGQLAWQAYGCARVAETGIGPRPDRELLARRRPPRLDRHPRRPPRHRRSGVTHPCVPRTSWSAGEDVEEDDRAFAGREGQRAVDPLVVPRSHASRPGSSR